MPDAWFHAPSGGAADLVTIAARLAVAVVVGALIALLDRATTRRRLRSTFPLTVALVVLPVLVAMTTLVIADSVARAFGLVGALSIVRFRTVVEDSRDTVFIVFAVVAGMAVGAGHGGVCLVGVPVVGAVVLGLHFLARTAREGPAGMHLTVRLQAGVDPGAVVAPVLVRHAAAGRLVGVATARQGAATDHRYEIECAPSRLVALAADLSAADGVQSVEVERP